MRVASALSVITAAGVACVNSQAPKGFTVQYAIAVYGCATNCSEPGAETLASAARGDTVWVRHDVLLLRALEPRALAQVIPDCGENATVVTPSGAPVVSLPPPTCPESVETHDFVVDSLITRLDQWVIDPSVSPAPYAVVGHILQRPLLEPYLSFTVQ
jgi:hypothetical protein